MGDEGLRSLGVSLSPLGPGHDHVDLLSAAFGADQSKDLALLTSATPRSSGEVKGEARVSKRPDALAYLGGNLRLSRGILYFSLLKDQSLQQDGSELDR
jgi:hypothetical protein